jgi:hypothetical protein
MAEEKLLQNKRPLNQAAKRAMEALKYPVSPYSLYVLQLADAAIEDGITSGDDNRVLLEYLSAWLQDKNPKRVMDRLMEARSGIIDSPETLNLPPEELAAEAAAACNDLLMEILPGYGEITPPRGR